jgi:hypothetical protein
MVSQDTISLRFNDGVKELLILPEHLNSPPGGGGGIAFFLNVYVTTTVIDLKQ